MTGMMSSYRAFSAKALKVVNDIAKKQFVVSIKGAEASLSYELDGKKITFIRTNVPDEFRGKGVGKILAKYAFDHALEKKLDVVCQCHFLENFYELNQSKYSKLRVTMDVKDEKP